MLISNNESISVSLGTNLLNTNIKKGDWGASKYCAPLPPLLTPHSSLLTPHSSLLIPNFSLKLIRKGIK